MIKMATVDQALALLREHGAKRLMAAEIVREKLLQFTHAELPFSTAVVVLWQGNVA